MFTNRFRLRENCRRSSQSVRRDRVFSRYTERCGNERVPTLNPASFGKLVRIIFPNVQTRRLGVRGESKYHYVDLSLFPEEDDQLNPPPFQMNTVDSSHDRKTQLPNSVQQGNMRNTALGQPHLPQLTADTAD